MDVAVGFLGGEDDRDPLIKLGPHEVLRLDDLGIALRIDHQGVAHRLNGVVGVGVGEGIADVRGVGFAGEFVAGLDEIVDAAVLEVEVGGGEVVEAVGNPVDDQGFDAVVPEGAVEGVGGGVDGVQAGLGGGGGDVDEEGVGGGEGAGGGGELEGVIAGGGEGGGGCGGGGVGEGDGAGAGGLGPGGAWCWGVLMDLIVGLRGVGSAGEDDGAFHAG